ASRARRDHDRHSRACRLRDTRRDTFFGKLRHTLYTVLEAGGSAPAAVAFDQFMVTLIIFNVLAVVVESVPSIHDTYAVEVWAVALLSIAIFAVEYLLRLWISIEIPAVRLRGPVVGRLMFASRFSMIIDFLAFAPSLIALFVVGSRVDLRILRVFRLLRF